MKHPATFGSSVRRYLLPVGILLLLFAQVVGSIPQTSLTIDEGLHITSGYSILRTGDFRLIEEHPPLVKFIAAWPLLLVPDLTDPRTLPEWELDVPVTDSARLVRVTEALIYDYQPLDRLVFAARLPIALLALLLGAVAYRWSSDAFGPWAGAFSLFLLAFDPNILAHAGVAATDLGTAFFILSALFVFQRFLRRPTWRRGVLAGLCLGLALGAKLSAMLLLPTQGFLILLVGIQPAQHGRSRLRPRLFRLRALLRWAMAYGGIFLLAAIVLWAQYGFEVGPVPTLNLSLPAPSHAIPWLRLRQHMQGGHTAFLMGKVSQDGWWYYFPIALALKTPLPILISWLAALLALFVGWRRRWQDEFALLLFPALYGAISLQTSLNIGYRHLLPILPPMAILAGRLAAPFQSRWIRRHPRVAPRPFRWAPVALGLWLVLGTLSIYPHYLAYFNELAGGPDAGYHYLVDSNTDWGQGLKELARYQEENSIESVYLSMFTFLDPAIYGVRYEPLTPMHGDTPAVFPSRLNPPPGIYVISTTTLQGIPLADPEMFDWFRKREPDARIAHVMLLYRVEKTGQPFQWVAQCITPVVPLSPGAVAEGFGRPDIRRAYFDCTQSWLVPDGARSSGWYVLFRDIAETDDPFVRAQLSSARLSFEQTRSSGLPPFSVYEATSFPVIPEQPSAMPTTVGDLRFLGYTAPSADDATAGEGIRPTTHALEIWTFWQVESRPDRPVSLMLHMVGPHGGPVAVGDALGVPVENWQPGDIIIQRHLLTLPPDAPSGDYALYTGAYWLDTLERWSVTQGGQPAGDQLALAPLEVTLP